MMVIQFPSRRHAGVDAAALAELEAAFDGDGTGPEAELWRELRADVRSLVAPVDPDFRRSLEQQLQLNRERPPRPLRRRPPLLRGDGSRTRRAIALAAPLALLAALLTTGALLGSSGTPATKSSVKGAAASVSGPAAGSPHPSEQGTLKASEGASSAGASLPASGEAPGESSARLQQLSASISLGAGSEGVQALADRVGAIAVAAGGFVESSKVELQRGTAGEASLTLKLPSAKLGSTLARLQGLAAVRSETQSLQDLTGQFDAVGARLAAARAERSALLGALAKAETAAALESLHQRIAQADSAIAGEERRQAGISHTASQAQVEVGVIGESPHAGGALTLGRGLHDAGHILTVSFAVALIALAVLVPLAILLAALLLGRNGWRRQRRERALGPG